MAALTTFLARLLPQAMGAAGPLARQALVDAAIEFCEKTHIVQQVLDPIDVVAGTRSYTPTLDAGLAVASLKKAWYLTTPLGIPADDNVNTPLAYHDQVGDEEVEQGDPTSAYWYESAVMVHPSPAENKSDALTLRVAVKPTIAATTLPDELLNHWRDAIVDGALARLLSMRGTSHYDLTAADRAQTKFLHAMNRAKITARTGRHSSNLTVAPRPFA